MIGSMFSLGGIALNLSVLTFLFSFISGRKHLLGSLLSLEGTMLMIFGLLCWVGGAGLVSSNYIVVFLTLMACEGALALSLLVVVVRWWGTDRMMALGLLQGN